MTEPQTAQLPSTNTHHFPQKEPKNTEAGLVCHWNECLKVFPDHPSLASHLSEDHVGWKKGGYFCDWSNCQRQGAKCHNRFALMMHLRIHTGEKPFECTVTNCGQTFGRMDALVRHQKAEHGEGGLEKPIKPISHPHHPHQQQQPYPSSLPSTSTNNNITPLLNPIISATHTKASSSTTSTPKARKISNKRPTTSLDMLSKNKRLKYSKSADWSSGDETEDELPSTTTNSKPLIPGSDYSQYRLARAQLHYVLRENEMLQDEYEIAQKKLKRMKTERRVLLDAVMTAEKYKYSEEEELIEDQDQEIHHHTKPTEPVLQ